MRFVLPAALLAQLRQRREEQRATHARAGSLDLLQDGVEREHDAFLLDPGMGPMAYLTADGRVLLDDRSCDGTPLREATDDEAIATIVVGSRKTGITALIDVVPRVPPGGATCPRCAGGRWDRQLTTLPCRQCFGRGWRPDPTA